MLTYDAISVLGDNYVWIISNDDSSNVAVVDPGIGPPVVSWLELNGKRPTSILITHGHHDHTGGIADLVERYAPKVFAPRRDKVAGATDEVTATEEVYDPELNLRFKVLDVPGHTSGHVAYVGEGIALTGDALFAGGCGRVFQGTFEQMYDSLRQLAALPAETIFYCAHEYTVANLRFALEVEPDNPELMTWLDSAHRIRAADLSTLPSTIGLELRANPFLRCEIPSVVEAAGRHVGHSVDPGAATFEVIRRWKDGWRG
ncbi:MAG: hydroxyacylglutathione hydrolase [bacterium]|nr:hydroxyacylglutathione hydrolase [bacterium]